MKKSLFLALFMIVALAMSAVSVYDIQYTTDPGPDSTYPSTYANQVVTVSGIVTGIEYDEEKYFISDPEGGAWKGVYVFDYTNTPAVGDLIEITGTVAEYYGLTEIKDLTSFNVLSSGNVVPAAANITTNEVNNEAYEGVLVRITGLNITSEDNGYGQFNVNDGTGDCQVDDEFLYPNTEFPIVPQIGGTIAQMKGIIMYSYGAYSINPRTVSDISLTVSNSKQSWGRVKSLYK